MLWCFYNVQSCHCVFLFYVQCKKNIPLTFIIVCNHLLVLESVRLELDTLLVASWISLYLQHSL